MPWWVPELVRVLVLGGGAVLVQRLIRRHGVAYAEEVFRETPRAGGAFLALADIAYYLIVVAYIAFTLQLERHGFERVRFRLLGGSIVALHVGVRA